MLLSIYTLFVIGTDLFQVAAHEIGHILGLVHSNRNKTVMAAFYDGYEPDFKLHADDIKQIQVYSHFIKYLSYQPIRQRHLVLPDYGGNLYLKY
jgi:hypothetical protein